MTAPLVYIVEDDVWQAEQFQRVLMSAGYEPRSFGDGIAAAQAIDDQIPSCIVLDVLLAGTTGVTLAHELQSYSDTGSIPIVLCTNLAEQIALSDVSPYGVRRILDKATMYPQDLVTAVRSVLL